MKLHVGHTYIFECLEGFDVVERHEGKILAYYQENEQYRIEFTSLHNFRGMEKGNVFILSYNQRTIDEYIADNDWKVTPLTKSVELPDDLFEL